MAQKHVSQRAAFVCDYFDEDIVYRVSKRGKTEVGVVVKSCENASSDEEDDEPIFNTLENDLWKGLKPGWTKVAWYPKGNTEILPEKKVKLYDRSLLPGDVVRRIDETGNNQRGYCKETSATLTLKVRGVDKVIENVPSSEFISLSPITSDVVCLYKSWIGYIEDMDHSVTLACKDGSCVISMINDLVDFKDRWEERDESSEFEDDLFYVGQEIIGPKKCLKKGNWISMSPEMKAFMASSRKVSSKIVVTVVDVTVVSITVKWLRRISHDLLSYNPTAVLSNICVQDSSVKDPRETAKKVKQESIQQQQHLNAQLYEEVPSEILTGDETALVKKLNYYQNCSLQVADLGYYVIKKGDKITEFREWTNSVADDIDSERSGNSHLHDFLEDEKSSGGNNLEMDGSSDKGAKKKRTAVSVKKVKEKRLKPAKRRDPALAESVIKENNKVPVEIVTTQTLVTVVWQNGECEVDIPSSSLYPVHHLDNHDFFPGDFIVENKDSFIVEEYGVIQRVDHVARTATVKWFRTTGMNFVRIEPCYLRTEEMSVYDVKDHPDFHFRPGCCIIRIPLNVYAELSDPASRAGQVIDLCPENGQLLCAWADGTKSLVYPQELHIIGEYDSDDLWGDSDYDVDLVDTANSSTGSWETTSERTILDATSPIQSPSNGQKSSHLSRKGSRDSTSQSTATWDTVETLRKTITQLEEWFSQNPSLNYRNGLSAMQKIFKITKELKAVDEQLGTNLTKLKDFHSLIETAKPPPGSPGTMQAISSKLNRLLSSVNEKPTVAGGTEYVKCEHSSGGKCAGTSTPPSQASSPAMCLEALKRLKSHLFQICSSMDSLKSVLRPRESGNGSNIAKTDETSELKQEEVEEEENPEEENPEEMKSTEEKTEEDIFQSGAIGTFVLATNVPDSHKYKLSIFQPQDPKTFHKHIKKEIHRLRSSLPSNIIVKAFDERMDLFSVMIQGPALTPYEDGLFFFDIQLPANYPHSPPSVHYLSYCNDRLNPNLYENGKVCVSLLGTWTGRGTEIWSPQTSSLLQLLVSIQGLILVSEPYYNEAGYLKQKGTLVGDENSRLYNEMVVVKLVQSMTRLLSHPCESFEEEIREHFQRSAKSFIERLEKWLYISTHWEAVKEKEEYKIPEFPLLPGSQGFCLSLQKALINFKQALECAKITCKDF